MADVVWAMSKAYELCSAGKRTEIAPVKAVDLPDDLPLWAHQVCRPKVAAVDEVVVTDQLDCVDVEEVPRIALILTVMAPRVMAAIEVHVA